MDSAGTNASSRIHVWARILKLQLRYFQPDPAACCRTHCRSAVYVPAVDAAEGMVEVKNRPRYQFQIRDFSWYWMFVKPS